MKSAKLAGAALGLALLMVPGAVMAAHPVNTHGNHGAGPKIHVVYGSITSYTAGSSVVISSAATSPASDVTITLSAKSKFKDLTSGGTAAPAAGDSAVALVVSHKGALVGLKLVYSESSAAFPIRQRLLLGRFASFTAADSNGNGSITITGRGKHSPWTASLGTNSSTKFFQNGDSVADASGYTAGEDLFVRAALMTDGSHEALVVRGHAKKAKA